jgi:murein DD-endopeptidase MepM/ murein hydrolase activator NlpD
MRNSGCSRACPGCWVSCLKGLLALLLLAPPLTLAAPNPSYGGASDSPLQDSAPAARSGIADATALQSLRPPLLHLRVTSPFGERLNPIMRRKILHRGVDYGAPSGTPVYAAQNGSVVALGAQDHAGIYVRLRHGGGVETLYAHLHWIMPGLRPGSYLRAGDILGFVGTSGFATGPHLHYEVLLGGSPIDPEQCCNPLKLASRHVP